MSHLKYDEGILGFLILNNNGKLTNSGMLGRCNNRKSIVTVYQPIMNNYGNFNALTAGHCLGYLLTLFDGFCKNA